MKTFLLGLIMSIGMDGNENKVAEDFSWVLEEMNADPEIALEALLTENKIRIYDLNGNLLEQYSQEQFISNELTLPELKEIIDSEFLFDYQGDSYYLKP